MTVLELNALRAQQRSNAGQENASVQERRDSLNAFQSFPIPDDVQVHTCSLGDIACERVVGGEGQGPAILYLHGGGYVIGSPRSHRHVAGFLASKTSGEVFVPDYRLAPEAPFPAAVEDALSAYRGLLASRAPEHLAIAGDSAGGGLAFALAVAAREAGLPMPAAIVGLSPWVNMGTENESYRKLSSVDALTTPEVVGWYSTQYLAGADERTPLASPLFADLQGLPSILIQTGDHECFFGDTVLMHQNLISAGVDSELSVWKGMFHVWHAYWPQLSEGREALSQVSSFILAHCK
jgi:phosphinothricin tripeptide acetyl hydrolase